MTITSTSTSESVIKRSNFLNLSDLWDFPAVSLSPAVTGREKKNKPVTQQHDFKSPICVFLCEMNRGHQVRHGVADVGSELLRPRKLSV